MNLKFHAFFFSKPGTDEKFMDPQYLHLQLEVVQNHRCSLQTCRVVDRRQEADLLQPGDTHHLHL